MKNIKKKLCSWITGFFMAWGMFLVLPCPLPRWDENDRDKMLLQISAVGLTTGVLWSLFALLLLRIGCPPLLQAALLCVFSHVLSGFIHLDGYMDCCDAILSRRDLETRRKILKDPHVGSFAVIGLVIAALLAFACFASLEPQRVLWKLLFVPAVSKSCSSAAIFLLPPMQLSSYREMKRNAKLLSLFFMLLLVLLPVLLWGREGLYAPIEAAACWLAIRGGTKDLGGMSGDISGFAITLGELAAGAALALL